MAVRPLLRLDDLLAGDEHDEPTCVGALSREEVLALMREADENEAMAPASFESGIRLTDEAKTLAIETPLVVIPRAPLLPAIEDELDREDTVIASVLQRALAVETAADELARVLDFDWEAHTPKADR